MSVVHCSVLCHCVCKFVKIDGEEREKKIDREGKSDSRDTVGVV